MINIQEKVNLGVLTSFRIGGEAKYFVDIKNIEELKESLDFAKNKQLAFFVLGGGSNVLISDKGFDGLVIRMRMNEVNVEENNLYVESGAALIKAINAASEKGLSGIETLAGIPGTIGGAVRGNAGAFGSEIGDCVFSVQVLDIEKGEIEEYKKDDCKFAYRTSFFKKNKNLIILSATFELKKGDPAQIKSLANETIAKRMSRGLQGVKSAGSYFMNPVVQNKDLCKEFEEEKGIKQKDDKLPAGWLIEKAGLTGKRIGDAMVHESHANYIINAGEAKAEDVIILVSFVKQQVRDQFGVELQEEVNYIGF